MMLVALAIGTSDDILPEIRATPAEVGLAAAGATLVLLRFGTRRRGHVTADRMKKPAAVLAGWAKSREETPSEAC